ncbi:MAG: fumarate reductase/succinate dehydrogenase flavoprotein domain protein [Sediminibacterium sp.]|nr:fumarate reductase/succinate dehydrogenase flavoprotein domain protein [Sediminibacterium sp.]
MASTEHFDVIIVGAGPIGLTCGLEASARGLRYLILEKGCLVNSLYHYPVNMTFFSTSERLEIGNIPFVSNNAKPTRNEALEYYRRVSVSASLNIRLFEEVRDVTRQDAGKAFTIQTMDRSYTCSNIVIATGFYGLPFLLNVKGEELPKVTHYYNDPHFYAFQKVLIVGANNSAVDAALETWRKGAEVTMVIRKNEIGERVKYWVRPDIINRIKEGSIKAYFSSHVEEIREHEVVIRTNEGVITVPNDRVVAATGYQPDLSFLQKMGIVLSDDETRKPSYDPFTHQTNVPGIYLAGVICGGMDTHSLFIENSREHAEKIISDIASKSHS